MPKTLRKTHSDLRPYGFGMMSAVLVSRINKRCGIAFVLLVPLLKSQLPQEVEFFRCPVAMPAVKHLFIYHTDHRVFETVSLDRF